MMNKNLRQDQHYEELLREGITAVKAGHQVEAQRLLKKATMIKNDDARAWLWLSGTTEEQAEKRKYLEYAVAAEPGNAAARRALSLLGEELDKTRLIPEGEQVQPRRPSQPEEARAEAFLCSQCGARMAYQIECDGLACQHCGLIIPVEKIPAADQSEQTLDFVLPTTRAHRWAEAQQQVKCSQCGAVSLHPPGQTASGCAYCGSNRVTQAAEAAELIDPQVIAPFAVAEKPARGLVKEWWMQGLTSPDDLAEQARKLQLHPVYLPFWIFDGAVEFPYSCQVKVGSGGSERWVARSGMVFELFDDILVSGAKALPASALADVEPFRLKEVVAFKPEFLAGWPAISFDRTLAEASLLAREKVISKVRAGLHDRVESGSEKRDLRLGGGKWSGMTYKYIMLPFWLGSYRYHGKNFAVLINGQTGKVGGEKPQDRTKIILLAGIALGVIVLLAMLVWMFIR
jgi:DNA-directed RNA polymerase subunit RPC12/RpoP